MKQLGTSLRGLRPLTALGLGLALVACGQPASLAALDPDAAFYQAASPEASSGLQGQGASGGLDTAFGDGGRVTLDPDGANMRPTALQVLPGGRLLVGGFSFYSSVGSEFALARLLPGGAPDPSWQGGQVVTTQLVRKDYLHGLDVQPDGKAVAVGSVSLGSFVDRQIGLTRYTASGALDKSFGTDGKVLLNFAADPQATEEGWGVRVLASGKLLVAGSSAGKFFVARLRPDGSLDSSFGAGGRVLIDPGAQVNVFAVAFRGGAVVLAGVPELIGPTSGTVSLARVLTSGRPDASFGSGGVATVSFPDPVQDGALAVQSDDRVLLAANLSADSEPYSRANIVRLRENGTLDPNFGDGGVIAQPFGATSGEVNDIKIQEADDKFVVGGTTLPGDIWNGYTLARYRMNGSPDASFGTGGVTQLSGEDASAERLALSGRYILLAGATTPSPRVVNTQVLRFFK